MESNKSNSLTLKEISKKHYDIMRDKHFNDNTENAYIKQAVNDFWTQNESQKKQIYNYLNNLAVSQALLLIHTEVSEAAEALRAGNICKADLSLIDNSNFQHFVKDTYQDELADIILRVLHLCASQNIDIERHIILKMDFNQTRAPKHGKLF